MSDFGTALRDWRTRRRMSQLDLGLSANVSSRHISFLESGRSRPSRGMVLRLCEELEVPRPARNQLLTAAGLAPAYHERALSADEMAPVRAAVAWILDNHAPYPAFAIDRHWRIQRLNPPAGALFGTVGLGPGDSVIDALLGNPALRGAIENLDEVLAHGLARLRVESQHLGGDPVLDAAIGALSAETGQVGAPGLMPAVIPTRYRLGDAVLALFSTITQFGSAEDIALSELRIEMMFPADEATRDLLHRLMPAV